MTRFSEAYAFLSSFRNLKAQSFVSDLMKESYANAVLEHHPHQKRVHRGDIQQKCNNLVGYIFDRISRLEDPRHLFSLFSELSRTGKYQEEVWFDFFVSFERETQRDIITIIDFLGNTLAVGVPEMPFPCSYQTLSGWKTTFRNNGFTIQDIRIEGFLPRRFNRSSHVIFVLGKEE